MVVYVIFNVVFILILLESGFFVCVESNFTDCCWALFLRFLGSHTESIFALFNETNVKMRSKTCRDVTISNPEISVTLLQLHCALSEIIECSSQ